MLTFILIKFSLLSDQIKEDSKCLLHASVYDFNKQMIYEKIEVSYFNFPFIHN